jgi:hypothetical protein
MEKTKFYLDDLNNLTIDIFDLLNDKVNSMDEEEDCIKIRGFLISLLGDRLVQDYRNWN